MTFKVIAYAFAMWTLISFAVGTIIGTIIFKIDQRTATPKWPWEKR